MVITKKKLGEASRESPTFRVKQREENFTSQNLSVNFGGLDGVGFMKTVVNFFETQRLMLGHANTDVLKGWRLPSNLDGTDSNNLSYMNFVWQGDELLIDNSETFSQSDPATSAACWEKVDILREVQYKHSGRGVSNPSSLNIFRYAKISSTL